MAQNGLVIFVWSLRILGCDAKLASSRSTIRFYFRESLCVLLFDTDADRHRVRLFTMIVQRIRCLRWFVHPLWRVRYLSPFFAERVQVPRHSRVIYRSLLLSEWNADELCRMLDVIQFAEYSVRFSSWTSWAWASSVPLGGWGPW